MAIFNLLFIFIKLLNLWLTFQLKFKISPEVKIIHPTIISQKRPEGTVLIGIIIIQPVVVGVTIIESNVRFHHVAVPPLPRCCDKTSRSGRYPYLNRKIESMKRKHTLPTSIGAEMPNTVASNPAADIVVSRSPELTCRMQLPIIPPPYTARYRKTSVRPPPPSPLNPGTSSSQSHSLSRDNHHGDSWRCCSNTGSLPVDPRARRGHLRRACVISSF